MQAIINAIRKKREFLNYPQEYMAVKLGCGQNAYSKIELGQTKLQLEKYLAICKLLDMDPSETLHADQ